MRKLLPVYVVYRVHMDLRGCRELSKPGGQNEFSTRQAAHDAIKKNTRSNDMGYPIWYEDFPYIIEEEFRLQHMRPRKK